MLNVLKRHQHTERANGAIGFRSISLLVSCCFFLSGAAGLIYQVLWVRLIDKVIGSAPFAVATVLTVFMAGLAMGSYLAGRYIFWVFISTFGFIKVLMPHGCFKS